MDATVASAMTAPQSVAKPRFAPDRTDTLFSLLYFALSYFYIMVITDSSYTYTPSFSVFVLCYAACTLAYPLAKGLRPSKTAYCWVAVLLCLGVPLFYYSAFPLVQLALTHLVALYLPLCLCGRLIGGKTSNFLFFDCLNMMFVVPFVNFCCQIQSLLPRKKEDHRKHHLGAILVGVTIGVLVLLLVLPLLIKADDNFFRMFADTFGWLSDHVGQIFWRLVLSIPVAGVLFGAACGSVHARHTDWAKADDLRKAGDSYRVAPLSTICTVFVLVGIVYALFLLLQGQYLFSAFIGKLPATFSYSEYARQGFFELLSVGSINLCILLVTNMVSAVRRVESRILRVCNIVLCLLSLLLTITAAAKLLLYIRTYGLTVYRILPSIFLIWMMLLFAALLVWQKKSFSIARFAVITGTVLVCLLCVFNVSALADQYNAAHGFALSDVAEDMPAAEYGDSDLLF